MDATPPGPDALPSGLVRACLTAPARCGSTRLVAVDGRSGSGKTRLAAALADGIAAAGEPVQVVHLDDVYPGWDGLAAAIPLLERWLLRPLAGGHPAGHYRYDWGRGTFGAWRPVAPGGVLLLEGVGAGAAALARHRGRLLWVQAPAGLRRARAQARDGVAFDRHRRRWADQEQAYLARDHPAGHADLVIGTTGEPDSGKAGDPRPPRG